MVQLTLLLAHEQITSPLILLAPGFYRLLIQLARILYRFEWFSDYSREDENGTE